MKLVLATAPTSKPVTLDEAKAFMRVLTTDEDALIESLIAAAIDKAEQITNRQLAVATYELYDDAVPSVLKLPKPPLVSVTSVQALRNGAYVDVDYKLDDKADPAVVYIDDTTADDEVNAFKVVYQSGYSVCPEAIKQWILVQVSTMYEQRESFQNVTTNNMPRTFIDHLLDSYRVRIV